MCEDSESKNKNSEIKKIKTKRRTRMFLSRLFIFIVRQTLLVFSGFRGFRSEPFEKPKRPREE